MITIFCAVPSVFRLFLTARQKTASAIPHGSSPRCGGKTVACARLISDGGYVRYLADVIVRPEFQGQGIGKTMIRMILRHIRESLEPGERAMTFLMAAKGRESFYRPLGFRDRPNSESGAGMSQWIEG